MTTVVTSETGGTAKPVGLLYLEPERGVVDAGSSTALAGSGLDPVFTADLLSACLAHERCGVHLYRSVAGRTASEQLREQYETFEAETLEHVRLLEQLIVGCGGSDQYVSPAARAAESAGASLVETTALLTGSVDLATAELSMLEAVMLAEAKDRANWELLAELATQITDADLRAEFEDVTSQVLAQEQEHFTWAASTRADMLFALATGDGQAGERTAGRVIDLTERSRDELYSTAQELAIEGRSQMRKAELAEAIAAETGANR